MPFPHIRRLRRIAVLSAVAGVLGAGAGSAAAADLILLQGDPPVQLSGNVAYGVVYIDGTLQLVGDTTITAAFVYFGPSASLQACFVPPAANDGCASGRNLVINSTGPITFNPSIDLTPGAASVLGAGGSLALNGAGVSVGGAITTTGTNAGAGSVAITSTGDLSTGPITAPGSLVRLTGNTGVAVNGDLFTRAEGFAMPSGIPGQAPSGGPVELTSAAGNVTVYGNVWSDGQNAPGAGGAGLAGGNGGPITISGGDVRVRELNATGGTSVDSTGGDASTITVAARGNLTATNAIDASGSASTNAAATPGRAIAISAGGHAALDDVRAVGGQGPLGGGGMAGGSIVITAASAQLGNLEASGANASNSATPGNGGAGGSIKVTTTASLALGQTTRANGGTSAQNGTGVLGGAGGVVDVSAGGNLTTGSVQARAGGLGANSIGDGSSGGTIRLLAGVSLTVAGAQFETWGASTSGSSASSQDSAPPRAGGNAGPIVLKAGAGTLSIGKRMDAIGGSGGPHPTDGQKGGAGGNGGQIDVIAAALGPIAAILADGGAGGDFDDDQGPGGAGGTIRHWGDGSLFDDTKVVSVLGGAGNPLGADGARVAEKPPASLAVSATGVLSFVTQSPHAQGFRILRSVAGGPLEVFAETTATAGIQAAGPPCVPLSFTVVAYHDALGWQSPGAQPVAWTAQPSATQTCGQAPGLKVKNVKKKLLRLKAKALKKKKWKAKLTISSNGIGSFDVAVARKGKKQKNKKPFARITSPIPAAGPTVVTIPLPKVPAALYALTLTSISPDGTGKATTKLTLEVKP